jgi:arabinan endo-1,5-alpha-L-arabinosidase
MTAGAPRLATKSRSTRWLRPVLVLALLLGVAPPSAALWMLPPKPYRSKDFAILKSGPLYHIFYTRTNTLDPNGASELSFGHATSLDLVTWTQQDTVLPVRPTEWDNLHVWAPHVVESEGVFYMFYTGVTTKPGMQFHQRTGLATSTDLFTWNRLDQPVFSCLETPWVYCDTTTASGGNFRDPFVMPDPSQPGHWLNYYSTVPLSDPTRYVVGVGQSAGDLAQWTDLGPLWVTYFTTTGFELAESPHLFQHDGLWYLFITTNGAQPLAWGTGTDPTGDPTTWTWRGSVSATVGLDTRFWFASEYLREGLHDYYAFVNFDRVDVRELQWRPDSTFGLIQPDLFHVTSMDWDRDSVAVTDAAELRLHCVNYYGRYAKLEAARLLGDGVEQLLPNSVLELPDSVAADSITTVLWTAVRWQDSTDTDTSITRLVVRTTDHTASARVLYVGPRGFCTGGSDPGGEIIDPGLVKRLPDPARLRTLYRAPVGDGLALLVELEAAYPARIDVFDVQGRRLGTLVDRTLPAGASLVPWEPARLGGSVRPGVYFARLTTPLGMRWSRVVVTR